jgi:hypothetical protein
MDRVKASEFSNCGKRLMVWDLGLQGSRVPGFRVCGLGFMV